MQKQLPNIWGAGSLLAFSGLDGQTDYRNGLVMRTSFHHSGLDIKIPAEGGAILFEGNGTLTGDFFECATVCGAIVDAHHLLLSGEVKLALGEAMCSATREGRTLVGVREFFDERWLDTAPESVIATRRAWYERQPLPQEIGAEQLPTLLKAYSQLRTQICAPEGALHRRWTTPDRWPHRRMWLWDTVFHALGLRHLNSELAKETLLTMLETQHADGFIPLCADPYREETMTQPPVLALGVKLLNESAPDRNFVAHCYPCLAAYIAWDLANRDSNGDGLLEWLIEEYEYCRSGESGMDNSPRFDDAQQLDAVDFNSLISMECGIMAEFAAMLGKPDDVRRWTTEQKRLNRLIRTRLWDKQRAFFCDFDPAAGRSTGVLAFSGFFPLLCGAATPEQAQSLVAHLHNPATFGTPFRIPSYVGEKYNKDMWRGPVWININYLIAHGLSCYGFEEEARALRSESMRKIEENYRKYGVLFEFFDDRDEIAPPDLPRKGPNQPDTFFQPFHDFGWTGTLYIDMAFSQMRQK